MQVTLDKTKKSIVENGTWNEEKKTYTFYYTLSEGIHTLEITTLDGTSRVLGNLACPTKVDPEYTAYTQEGCQRYNWPREANNIKELELGTEVNVIGTFGSKWALVTLMNNKNDRFFVPIELLTFASMNGWRYTLDITNDTIQIYNDTLDDVEGVYYLKVSNSEATWSLKDRCYRITYFISAPHFRREYSISAALKMEQGIDYEIHIIDARNEKESGTLRIRIDQEQRYYFTTIIVQDWKSNGVNINWLSHPKTIRT